MSASEAARLLIDPGDIPEDEFAAALDRQSRHVVEANRVAFLQRLAVGFDLTVVNEEKAETVRRELIDGSSVLDP